MSKGLIQDGYVFQSVPLLEWSISKVLYKCDINNITGTSIYLYMHADVIFIK